MHRGLSLLTQPRVSVILRVSVSDHQHSVNLLSLSISIDVFKFKQYHWGYAEVNYYRSSSLFHLMEHHVGICSFVQLMIWLWDVPVMSFLTSAQLWIFPTVLRVGQSWRAEFKPRESVCLSISETWSIHVSHTFWQRSFLSRVALL